MLKNNNKIAGKLIKQRLLQKKKQSKIKNFQYVSNTRQHENFRAKLTSFGRT